MTSHSVLYRESIASARWRNLKALVAFQRGWRCEECGGCGKLELHHKHYRTLGEETERDVRLLCRICHWIEHVITNQERWSAKIVATYGENWAERFLAEPGLSEQAALRFPYPITPIYHS